MLRRVGVLLLVSVLLIPTPSAISALKSGNACKVLGSSTVSQGKVYKCVLVKGKKVLQVQPAVKKAPSLPTPVKDNLFGLSSDLALNAFLEITKYLNKQPELTAGEVILELSPNSSAKLAEATLKDMEKGFRFWQSYTPRTTKIHMVFADRQDLEWFKATMVRIQPGNQEWLPRIYNLAETSPKNQYAGSNGFDSDGNALFFYLPGVETTPTSGGWLGVGPHEWTHFAQGVVTGDVTRGPCWFNEGQATYYGNVISNDSQVGWAKVWKNQIQSLKTDFPSFFQMEESTLRQWFSEHELNTSNNVCGPDGVFTIGGLATEYLVGTVGVEGVTRFQLKLKTDENWKAAISDVTGKPFESLMADIVKFVLLQRTWASK